MPSFGGVFEFYVEASSFSCGIGDCCIKPTQLCNGSRQWRPQMAKKAKKPTSPVSQSLILLFLRASLSFSLFVSSSVPPSFSCLCCSSSSAPPFRLPLLPPTLFAVFFVLLFWVARQRKIFRASLWSFLCFACCFYCFCCCQVQWGMYFYMCLRAIRKISQHW